MVTADEILADPAQRAYLLRMIGDDGLELLEKFPEGEEKSDEELAELTEISLNTVRHTLYTLYGKRLAVYRREKNPETGWLTYLWTLKLDMVAYAIQEDMETVLEVLKLRLAYETENDFYFCPECGNRITFIDAIARDFKCIHCDREVEHFDNDLITAALERRVTTMKRVLGVN